LFDLIPQPAQITFVKFDQDIFQHKYVLGGDGFIHHKIQHTFYCFLHLATIDDLIGWQVRYAGAAGFISNLGGIITLPVSIPANLASVLLIQLRMIAAIAHIRGYKIDDPAVRTMAFMCLTGNGGASVLRGASVGLGTRMSARVISHLSGTALGRINQAVGAKLAAMAGAKGLVSVAKILPFVGGVIGGGFDAVATRGIALAAKRFFAAKPDESLEDFIPAADALPVLDETAKDPRRLSGPKHS